MGNVWTIKVVLKFWFGHWKCHFFGLKDGHFWQKWPFLDHKYDWATRGQRKMRGTRFSFMLFHSHWCFLIHLQPEVRRINWQQKTWSIWASIDLFSPWLILKIKAMAMWCESKRLIILRKLFSTLQHPSRVSSLYFVHFAHIHSSFIRYFKLLWNQITVSLSWSKKRL